MWQDVELDNDEFVHPGWSEVDLGVSNIPASLKATINNRLIVIEALQRLIDSVTDNNVETIDRVQVLRLRAFGVGLGGTIREIRNDLNIT